MVTFCAGAHTAPDGAPVVFVVFTHAELERFTAGEACVIPTTRLRDTLEKSGYTLEQLHSLHISRARSDENEVAIVARVARTLKDQGAEVTVIDRRTGAPGEN